MDGVFLRIVRGSCIEHAPRYTIALSLSLTLSSVRLLNSPDATTPSHLLSPARFRLSLSLSLFCHSLRTETFLLLRIRWTTMIRTLNWSGGHRDWFDYADRDENDWMNARELTRASRLWIIIYLPARLFSADNSVVFLGLSASRVCVLPCHSNKHSISARVRFTHSLFSHPFGYFTEAGGWRWWEAWDHQDSPSWYDHRPWDGCFRRRCLQRS